MDIELAALLESLSLQQRIRVGPSLVDPSSYLAGLLSNQILTFMWRQTMTNEPTAPTVPAPTAPDMQMIDAENHYQVSSIYLR